MVKVGVHVSIAGSLDMAVDRARDAGCDVFQIFSRNPGLAFGPIPDEVRDAFRSKVKATGMIPVDHMPYLPNLASPKQEVYEKSVATLTAELERCAVLGIPYLVTHLGHHLGDGMAGGRARVIKAINTSLAATDAEVMLLLENTAGEKNSVGSDLEHLRAILDGLDDTRRIGFCFDTCHAFAAGYDLRTAEGLEETLGQFDEMIGLKNLRVIHLTDPRGEKGSRLDRHEHIGLGGIGTDGIRRIVRHAALRNLPFICETPVDERRDDRGNIAVVRELAG
jgi:deoxyribonuclease-4